MTTDNTRAPCPSPAAEKLLNRFKETAEKDQEEPSCTGVRLFPDERLYPEERLFDQESFLDSESLLPSESLTASEPLIPGLRYFQADADNLKSGNSEPCSTEATNNKPIGAQINDKGDLRLGRLLVDLGLVTEDLLQHGMEMAIKLNIPIGRVLIASGWLTDRQIQVAVQIQALLKEQLISKEAAAEVAERMLNRRLSLNEALEQVAHDETALLEQIANDMQSCDSIKLGELFVASGIIRQEELDDALSKSRTLGLPLGRVLMLSASIIPQILETAINAQRFIRQNKIKKEDAIEALKAAAKRHNNDSLNRIFNNHKQPYLKNIRLGELFVLAGILSEQQIEYALEMGFVNNLPIGKVLIDLGLISEQTIDQALQLQKLVSIGSLNPLEAVYVLIDVHFHGVTSARAISDNVGTNRGYGGLQFSEYLAKTGIISTSAIEDAVRLALRNTHLTGRALLMTGALDEETLQTALRSFFYIQERMLSMEEGIFIFDHCHRMSLSVDEMIEKLGWSLNSKYPDESSDA